MMCFSLSYLATLPQCAPDSSLRGQRIGKLVGELGHKHREGEREQLHERRRLPMPAEDPQKSRENIDGQTSPCPCQQAAHHQVALEVVAFSLQIPPREKENRDQGKRRKQRECEQRPAAGVYSIDQVIRADENHEIQGQNREALFLVSARRRRLHGTAWLLFLWPGTFTS